MPKQTADAARRYATPMRCLIGASIHLRACISSVINRRSFGRPRPLPLSPPRAKSLDEASGRGEHPENAGVSARRQRSNGRAGHRPAREIWEAIMNSIARSPSCVMAALTVATLAVGLAPGIQAEEAIKLRASLDTSATHGRTISID